MKTHKLWSAEEIILLRELWPTTSGGLIAERLGRPIFSVYTKASLLGLPKREEAGVAKKQRHDAWTPEHQTMLEQRYGKIPTEDLAQLTGHPVGMVVLMARKTSIANRIPTNHNTSSYTVQHASFHILTPDLAYVLGFVLADGNLHNRTLQIGVTDREVVEYIRRVLKSNHPITVGRNTKSTKDVYSLRIGEKSLYNSLLARGITPNKSLTATMPKVPDALFFHFLRGYFDGDGTAVFRRGKDLYVSFSSGSERLLEQINETLDRLVDIRGSIRRSSMLEFYGRRAELLGKFMYQDSRFHLARKAMVFDAYANRENRKLLPLT